MKEHSRLYKSNQYSVPAVKIDRNTKILSIFLLFTIKIKNIIIYFIIN